MIIASNNDFIEIGFHTIECQKLAQRKKGTFGAAETNFGHRASEYQIEILPRLRILT